MTELLETLEYIDGRRASAAELFGRDGRSIREWSKSRQGTDPEYMAGLVETTRIIAGARKGNPWDQYRLKETMSTSDFPLYFGDIIDRKLWIKYRSLEPTYTRYANVRELRDFRTANIFAFDGAEGQLDLVPELTEYPAASLAETRYQIAVAKHGRRLPFSWESIINDDQGMFDDVPARFANASARSKEKDVAKLFVDASGPHASLYTTANKNQINTTNGAASNNPALSDAGIQDAFKVFANQVDADGEPIFFDSFELVVPLALQNVADRIISTMEFRIVEGANTRIIRGNGVAARVRVSVNPYITTIASTANGKTSWFMFATPSEGERSALVYANLRGHVGPELFVKEPNQRRVGGGAVSPLEGDYATDAIDYKVRDTWGTARGDPKTTVASNGSGS
jgi:hypothetical protein